MLGDTVQVVEGRLRVGAIDFTQKLDAAISQSLIGSAADLLTDPKPLLAEIAGADRRLVVYVLPVLQPLLAERFLTHTRAIVLVIEQKIEDPAEPTVVRDLLGLTLGEAKIAAMIGAGLSPKEAAEKLGIKENTARVVLKKVFSKTGVSRQSELVALLGRLVVRRLKGHAGRGEIVAYRRPIPRHASLAPGRPSR